MPGFSSVTGLESVMYSDNCCFDGSKRDELMDTDGQLWIGSTAAPHVKLGGLTASGGATITNGSGTINIDAGPANAVTGTGTDNHIVRWNGTGVPLIQDSNVVINDTGQVQGIDGTTGAPSYSFTNDLTTGAWLNGAATYSISTGGTERVRFNNSRTQFVNGAGLAFPYKSTAVSANVDAFDYIVAVTDNSAARTLTLPNSSLVAGQMFILKDQAGTAGSANNITVTVTGGTKTIDGQTSVLIDVNFGSMTLYYDGSDYFIV